MYQVQTTPELTISEAIECLIDCIRDIDNEKANSALDTLLESSDRRVEALEKARDYILEPANAGDIRARRIYLEMGAALCDQSEDRTLPMSLPAYDAVA